MKFKRGEGFSWVKIAGAIIAGVVLALSLGGYYHCCIKGGSSLAEAIKDLFTIG